MWCAVCLCGAFLAGASGLEAPPFFLRVLAAPAAQGPTAMGPAHLIGPEAPDPGQALLITFVPAEAVMAPSVPAVAFVAALQRAYGSRGLRSLLVVAATDDGDAVAAARAAWQAAGPPLPLLHDAYGLVAPRYRVGPLPHHVLVGAKGRMLPQVRGPLALPRLLAEVRRALAIPPGEPPPPALAALLAG